MLDYDLAELYGVETKQLKRQVKRNMRRFPSDFMIEISERDMKSLRCQFGTSNRGGDRYGAYAFTEQGIAMLSSILRSERAIDPYSDAVTLEVLSKKRPGVKVRLVCKDRGKPTQTEIAKFNRLSPCLSLPRRRPTHFRWRNGRRATSSPRRSRSDLSSHYSAF